MTRITPVAVLTDNYAYIIEHDGQCAFVDPGEAGPVLAFLAERNLKPRTILLTHHHGDHVAGAAEIKDAFGAEIIAPAIDAEKIMVKDKVVKPGDPLSLGGLNGEVIATPGHTKGHVAFYFPAAQAVFTGDTLFSLGCGRLFEDTAAAMFSSLQKLAALPDDTMIYCGHEYTAANALFALEADPDNQDLIRRAAQVRALRQAGKPTIPVSLGAEKRTNPFLRCANAARFAELRNLKDGF